MYYNDIMPFKTNLKKEDSVMLPIGKDQPSSKELELIISS